MKTLHPAMNVADLTTSLLTHFVNSECSTVVKRGVYRIISCYKEMLPEKGINSRCPLQEKS
jgi:hypothetical protein